jgi:hypothetical protein
MFASVAFGKIDATSPRRSELWTHKARCRGGARVFQTRKWQFPILIQHTCGNKVCYFISHYLVAKSSLWPSNAAAFCGLSFFFRGVFLVPIHFKLSKSDFECD